MAGSYTKILIQSVFAVKYRRALIHPIWEQQLYGYIGATLNKMGHVSIVVNGHIDHVHMFWAMKPTISLSDTMREVKANASRWVNASGFVDGRFEWQQGYAAFSYNHAQVNMVTNYIKRQHEHHQTQTFRAEYLDMLRTFDVAHDEAWVLDELV
jgi:REP element-mobilizing transposase RayT